MSRREYFKKVYNIEVTPEELMAAKKAAEVAAREKEEKMAKEAEENAKFARAREKMKAYLEEKAPVHVITDKDIEEAEKFTGQKFEEKNNG